MFLSLYTMSMFDRSRTRPLQDDQTHSQMRLMILQGCRDSLDLGDAAYLRGKYFRTLQLAKGKLVEPIGIEPMTS